MSYLGRATLSPESSLEVTRVDDEDDLVGIVDDPRRATDNLAIEEFFALVKPSKQSAASTKTTKEGCLVSYFARVTLKTSAGVAIFIFPAAL
jgi:hypothetical protein